MLFKNWRGSCSKFAGVCALLPERVPISEAASQGSTRLLRQLQRSGFLLLLELLHALDTRLVPPLEQRRRVDVRMRVVLVVRHLKRLMRSVTTRGGTD